MFSIPMACAILRKRLCYTVGTDHTSALIFPAELYGKQHVIWNIYIQLQHQ